MANHLCIIKSTDRICIILEDLNDNYVKIKDLATNVISVVKRKEIRYVKLDIRGLID